MTRAKAATARGRTAYLVLGMHRSGTSATAQLLALAGAQLPRNVMPGDSHNAKGYFEPWKIAMFNDQRLRAAGGAWDDVFAFPHRALPRPSERDWLTRAGALFAEEFPRRARPLLKDPRITALLPFWREVLDDQAVAARCVISVRHPLAVAGSLARRDGFEIEKSLLLWSAYMLAAEAYTRDLPRVFVDYDRMLADWRGEFARIESALGPGLPPLKASAIKAIDGFLTPDLRHNAAGPTLNAHGWVGELTASVQSWCAAAAIDQALSAQPLESAGAELLRRREAIGALISPTARDLDSARAELVELRQSEAFHRKRAETIAAELEGLQAEQAEALALVNSILTRA